MPQSKPQSETPAGGAKSFLLHSPHRPSSTAQGALTQPPLHPARTQSRRRPFGFLTFHTARRFWESVHLRAEERLSLKSETGSAEEMRQHLPQKTRPVRVT